MSALYSICKAMRLMVHGHTVTKKVVSIVGLVKKVEKRVHSIPVLMPDGFHRLVTRTVKKS